MHNRRFPSNSRAFSLVELIVVMVIIGIIATFVVPAATTIIRGSQVSQASQILMDQISYGRQLALSKNKTVEVRFIQFADPETPGETLTNPSSGKFRAIQLMEVTESGIPVPLSKVQMLPNTVMMSDNKDYSTLIAGRSLPDYPLAAVSANTQDPPMPRNIQQHYNYMPFRFLPDGSTSLSPTSQTGWFLTLHAITDLPKITGASDFKKVNFYTMQIDAVSGATSGYRPTAL